ncbi:MAG TPA: hypothetical protein PLV65_04280 [Tenuifilaceae bacterium]|nr:hypothetical protein [Tenuifilaceae bacterium]
MKYIALPILLLIAFSATSQETVESDTIFNQVDHLQQKQGHWKKFYRHGSKAYQGFFKDDKPRGEFIRYHENGEVSARLLFTECGDTAQATLYNTVGRKMAAGKYLRTKKHGVWNYFGQLGEVVFTESYDEGKKHGEFITYYPSGEVYEKVTWENDQKNGPTVQFYPDGSTKSLLFYKDGLENGPIKTYYMGGDVRLEGQYANGLKDGIWKLHNPETNEVKQTEYVNGVATNFDELVEKETQELDELIKNIGKISEPTINDFVGGGQNY